MVGHFCQTLKSFGDYFVNNKNQNLLASESFRYYIMNCNKRPNNIKKYPTTLPFLSHYHSRCSPSPSSFVLISLLHRLLTSVDYSLLQQGVAPPPVEDDVHNRSPRPIIIDTLPLLSHSHSSAVHHCLHLAQPPHHPTTVSLCGTPRDCW
ncbi:uncharacterized protein DS421_3g92080 [Arachis hypogaea]|nr:uncharacterized protein DS421_3g92080 [Arachis hypogaea]